MADKTTVTSELSRDLTLFQITMMGLGMMIGAGVFLGIGNAIRIAGPGGVILTFVLNGVIAIMTACSYAELASAIPHTGGAYNYTRIGLGRGTSFLAGWMEWFASSVAGSLYAVTFAIYVVRYLEVIGVLNWLELPTLVIEKGVAVAIAVLFIYINYRGASETGKVGAFFTFFQTLFLIIIGLIGLVVIFREPVRLQNFHPFLPHGWSKLLVTMGFTYVAFEGFEVIAQTGDEAINPRQNLPKAMLYSVFIVTLTYTLVSFASLVAVKTGHADVEGEVWQWIGSHKERGFGEAISRLIPAGNVLLTLAIIFASTSALNATIYSATRALYALGRDRMVPPFFSRISSKKKTPWIALFFTGILVIVVAAFLPTIDVASSASMMFILLFFLVNITVIKVRYNMSDELQYGFLMPFFPYLPLIAIVCQSVLAAWMHHMSIIAWIIAPSWVLTGTLIYQTYSKPRTLSIAGEIQVLEEEKAKSGEGFKAMVPVANPENALMLINAARALCRAKNAQIDLLHMVPVPDQIPLSDAEQYMIEGREAIVEAMLYLQPRFRISTTIRYCRNIARGIIGAVREKKVDLLLMGWHGKPKTHGYRLGSTVDPIIERAPCDLVIVKGCIQKRIQHILVPVAGGPNSRFALEVASILADPQKGRITVYHASSDGQPFDLENFIGSSKIKNPNRFEARTVKTRSVERAILEASQEVDLVVLGCSRRTLLYQVTHATIPDIVALNCEKPLVMVKAAARIESWIKRLL
jgi:APA family basic amino acid/polyamine antiporter